MKAIGQKILHLTLVVIAVSMITFFMVDLLPGDAAFSLAGQQATLEDIQALRHGLGLDKPAHVRYFKWAYNALHADLGTSFVTREPVAGAIASRLPVTIELMLLAQLTALALAVPSAILCSSKPLSAADKAFTGICFATMSAPIFVMALVLIYLFAVRLQWLPATGYVPHTENLWLNIRSFLLPSLSIALVEWVPLMRVLRSDLITTLQREYILLARAKGLSVARIMFRHALRPSSITLLTILGLQICHLIGGALRAVLEGGRERPEL